MKEDSLRFTLSKQERLHKKLEIEYLFTSGKKVTSFPVSIVFCDAPAQESTKVIFLASKRVFNKAYQRNKAKRLLREVYRLHKHQVPTNTFIGLSLLNSKHSYASIENGFLKAIKKIV